MKLVFKNKANIIFILITCCVFTMLYGMQNHMQSLNYINNDFCSRNGIVFQLEGANENNIDLLYSCLSDEQVLWFPLNSNIYGVYANNYHFDFIDSGRFFNSNSHGTAVVGRKIMEDYSLKIGNTLSLFGKEWKTIATVAYRDETILDQIIMLDAHTFSSFFDINGKVVLDGKNVDETYKKIIEIFPQSKIIESSPIEISYSKYIKFVLYATTFFSAITSLFISYNYCNSIKKNSLIFRLLSFKVHEIIAFYLVPYSTSFFIGMILSIQIMLVFNQPIKYIINPSIVLMFFVNIIYILWLCVKHNKGRK